MMLSATNLFWYCRDLIWPSVQPPSRAEVQKEMERQAAEILDRKRRVEALPDNESSLREYAGECTRLLEDENTRLGSVQARLTSIVGLSSIAATIVFGGIIAQVSGTLRIQSGWLRWIMALGSFYLAMQLCCAILAALNGLKRQGYLTAATRDILPLPTGESHPMYLRRRIGEDLRVLADHRCLNDKKVAQMAVAHRAMKNFLWSLLVFAVIGTYGGITSPNQGNDLTETLRKNHELQELLRGPQGPAGPKGEPGSSQSRPSPTPHRSKRKPVS